jgi:hypothetical protein
VSAELKTQRREELVGKLVVAVGSETPTDAALTTGVGVPSIAQPRFRDPDGK